MSPSPASPIRQEARWPSFTLTEGGKAHWLHANKTLPDAPFAAHGASLVVFARGHLGSALGWLFPPGLDVLADVLPQAGTTNGPSS